MSGIFIGIGEVLGGGLFGILGKKTIRWGRSPIVVAGFVIHIVAFFLIFLNIPNPAPVGKTEEGAFIDPNPILAIFCSFLLGFGDSCFNTQIYSTLGGLFSDDSASAFAIFKFTQVRLKYHCVRVSFVTSPNFCFSLLRPLPVSSTRHR